jgi:nicotinamide mononucleotide adenylyltransferase
MKHYFLGKFQPPHLGHVLTFNRLKQERQIDLRIMVTLGESDFTEYSNIKTIFTKALNLKETHISASSGSIELGTIEGLPQNATYYTGNEQVIKILKAKGYTCEYVARSWDKYYTGTGIRAHHRNVTGSQNKNPENVLLYDGHVQLADARKIRPIEKVMNKHLEYLEEAILSSQSVLEPLLVDVKTGALLDGSHRYAILLKLGCKYMPVRFVNYDHEAIFVGSLLHHRFLADKKKILTKDLVRETAKSGSIFEPRTTRHFFPFRKEHIPTPLNQLRPHTTKENIKHLLWDGSNEDERQKNLAYIDELNAEKIIIEAYLQEQNRVKDYLLDQVNYND